MITDSVFILFRNTDFSTILTCLGGKVYQWWVIVIVNCCCRNDGGGPILLENDGLPKSHTFSV